MSSFSEQRDRFRHLADAICTGDATAEERAELDKLLLADAALRDEYLERCRLHAELSFHSKSQRAASALLDSVWSEALVEGDPASAVSIQKTSNVAEQSAPRRKFQPSALRSLSRHSLLTGVAASLLIVGIGLTIMHNTTLPDPVVENSVDEVPEATESTEIATLTGWHRIDWKEGYRISAREHRLESGKVIAIESGLAEITYDTGARVLIEGPAEFTVGEQVSENAGFLRLGNLVARCETPESKGFTIATPAGSVVDIGTEFGVEVAQSGSTEFVVLSGTVDVVGQNRDGTETRMQLEKDQSAFIAASGSPIQRRGQVDPQLVANLRNRFEAIARSKAMARQIRGVTIHDVSSELAGDHTTFDRAAAHTVNGSGLVARGHVDGPPDGTMWLTTGTFAEPQTTLPAHITFDLGNQFDVSHLHVWNYNESTKNLTSRGASEVEISVSTTGEPGEFTKVAREQDQYTFEFPRADGTETYPGFVVDLRNVASRKELKHVRYIRFDIKSSHSKDLDDQVVGLSEVIIFGAAAAEEPAAGEPVVSIGTLGTDTTPKRKRL